MVEEVALFAFLEIGGAGEMERADGGHGSEDGFFQFCNLLIGHLEAALAGFAFKLRLFDKVEQRFPEFVVETLVGVDEEFVELELAA